MSIAVLGAGAFGSALAISLAQDGREVTLWGRNADVMREMAQSRSVPRLPGAVLPETVRVVSDLSDFHAEALLLAVPMQTLSALLTRDDLPNAAHMVACCKGIDLETGRGPTALIADHQPQTTAAILTGPSFAADIAKGLPTALTLACTDPALGKTLQETLTTANLRLYRSTDPVGAELGGALKNVIAIACGLVIGGGFGVSARAAAIARGMAEMQRLAQSLGAEPETLAGLSGFGDLVLTCTSEQSRNFAFGAALGSGQPPSADTTVEGKATAIAALKLAKARDIDMPITAMVSAVCAGELDVPTAMRHLMQRDLKAE